MKADAPLNEIILYQPDNVIQLEVLLENETVWLSLDYFNLDVIISVGYRVKSKQGTQFRQWANRVLKEYLLKGYAVNKRFDQIEKRVIETEKRVDEHDKKIEFFVKTSLPPVEGIFYEGQIFDAYSFAADLIKSAKKSIALIDNYIDESALTLLSKRNNAVEAVIYTSEISPQLQLDLKKYNAQYPRITVKTFKKSHDRFLIIDDTVYHIGASLKDLGKKWFAFSKMVACARELLGKIEAELDKALRIGIHVWRMRRDWNTSKSVFMIWKPFKFPRIIMDKVCFWIVVLKAGQL